MKTPCFGPQVCLSAISPLYDVVRDSGCKESTDRKCDKPKQEVSGSIQSAIRERPGSMSKIKSLSYKFDKLNHIIKKAPKMHVYGV
ncbi:MAG: hypothetical protein CO090_06295 [Acidobacteria bacterium CG_4_9_14_3_um_filter_49_7]|nr:MAG: hypothetical protein CO090_06295 [Acidobacteria bacterium CG_4_9_14_3_um_filter_49_7]